MSGLEAIEAGLSPEIRKTSATKIIIDLLLKHPEGLSHPQILELSGIGKKTIDAALRRLTLIENELKSLGLVFTRIKSRGNSYLYKLEFTPTTTQEDSFMPPVTAEMKEATYTEVRDGLLDRRNLEMDQVPIDWFMEVPIGNAIVKNTTWAFSVAQGEFFAVRKIMAAALEDRAVRSSWLRHLWREESGKNWPDNFFHELSATSLHYAPELGLIIRCVGEHEERGVVMGAFLEVEKRKRLQSRATPIKRTGLETCFDHVRIFDPRECRRRLEGISWTHHQSVFPKHLFEAVIRDQQRGVERSAVALGKEIGMTREAIQVWMKRSIERREDWKLYLRSRIGDRGLECVAYEGPLEY